jgi:hypothetical protein
LPGFRVRIRVAGHWKAASGIPLFDAGGYAYVGNVNSVQSRGQLAGPRSVKSVAFSLKTHWVLVTRHSQVKVSAGFVAFLLLSHHSEVRQIAHASAAETARGRTHLLAICWFIKGN